MSLPEDYPRRSIAGFFEKPNGEPMSGTVLISTSTVVIHAPSLTQILPVPVVLTLVDGAFDQPVPPNDRDDLHPIGLWAYKVELRIIGYAPTSFYINVPEVGSGPVNVGGVQVAPPGIPTAAFITQAALDAALAGISVSPEQVAAAVDAAVDTKIPEYFDENPITPAAIGAATPAQVTAALTGITPASIGAIPAAGAITVPWPGPPLHFPRVNAAGTAIEWVEIETTPPDPDAPVITSFAATPDTGDFPLEVDFVVNVTDGASPVTSVVIDPLDGSADVVCTEESPGVWTGTHTYTTAGVRAAKATASDGTLTDTAYKGVTVTTGGGGGGAFHFLHTFTSADLDIIPVADTGQSLDVTSSGGASFGLGVRNNALAHLSNSGGEGMIVSYDRPALAASRIHWVFAADAQAANHVAAIDKSTVPFPTVLQVRSDGLWHFWDGGNNKLLDRFPNTSIAAGDEADVVFNADGTTATMRYKTAAGTWEVVGTASVPAALIGIRSAGVYIRYIPDGPHEILSAFEITEE